jgi:class 3 adenylate cyclase
MVVSVVYKGLRVRMGVHVGTPKAVRDPMTRRVEYIGPVVNAAARITAMTHGGQIVLSHAAHAKLSTDVGLKDNLRVVCLGRFEMPDAPRGTQSLVLFINSYLFICNLFVYWI